MFVLPELPYSYNALEPYIDEQTMRLHHDKHHGAYVKNLNEALFGHEDFLNMNVDELIKNIGSVPQDIRTKVFNNAGQHANHSLFWQAMGPGKGGEPRGWLLDEINKNFGNFTDFKDRFDKTATGIFGSGWVWLAKNNDKLEILGTLNADTPLTQGKTPLLTLDVWEHAYYLKYKNMRADYVRAWWNVVNWEEVEKRLKQGLA